jgi:hypothetical protein
MAAIAAGERVTWHHNLFAHCRSRNPRFAGGVHCDFRNNVIYNWGDMTGYGEFERLNLINNFYKPGPSTTQRPQRFHVGDATVPLRSFYARGNIMWNHADITRDNWLGIGYDRHTESDSPFDCPPVETETADSAYRRVLDSAGATLPSRDDVDARVVEDVRRGTGRIIDTTTDLAQ